MFFSLCHPGPCPSCPAFVTKSCVCGKTRYLCSCVWLKSHVLVFLNVLPVVPLSQPMRCGQLSLLQCDKVCGALLNCAEHTCTQVCHSGQCQPCQLQVQQCECHMQWSSRLWVKHHHNSRLLPLCLVVCYCGVTVRETLCGTDRGGFDGVGHFSCEKLCGK